MMKTNNNVKKKREKKKHNTETQNQFRLQK